MYIHQQRPRVNKKLLTGKSKSTKERSLKGSPPLLRPQKVPLRNCFKCVCNDSINCDPRVSLPRWSWLRSARTLLQGPWKSVHVSGRAGKGLCSCPQGHPWPLVWLVPPLTSSCAHCGLLTEPTSTRTLPFRHTHTGTRMQMHTHTHIPLPPTHTYHSRGASVCIQVLNTVIGGSEGVPGQSALCSGQDAFLWAHGLPFPASLAVGLGHVT